MLFRSFILAAPLVVETRDRGMLVVLEEPESSAEAHSLNSHPLSMYATIFASSHAASHLPVAWSYSVVSASQQ